MSDEKKSPDPEAELKAMKGVSDAIKDLPSESKARVLWWAADTHGVALGIRKAGKGGETTEDERENGIKANSQIPDVKSFAEFYDAASPTTDVERALVAGCWHADEKGEFASFTINKALKDLGHGVKDITRALEGNIEQQPRLILQVKKAGKSRQARKIYKVTQAGKNAVEAKLKNPGIGDD